MDVWTALILLAALVVVFTKAMAFLTRRSSDHLRRRFTDFNPPRDAGLRGDRTGARATFPRANHTAHKSI